MPLSRDEKLEYIKLREERERRTSRRLIDRLYPDSGPLRRELYRPHMAFFRAGAEFNERAIIAANRIGKSFGIGGYEVTYHLTGDYPSWWEGRRFDHPIKVWACGDTTQTVRDIIQEKLLGPPDSIGTGLIPGDLIVETKAKAGSVPDAIESIGVKHVSGGISRLTFKSYDQKRKAFQGTEQDVIWLDEECPMPIYTECLIRTMTTNGIILLTFTPLMGLSDVVLSYMPGGKIGNTPPNKFIVSATWDDAPHLTEKEKQELYDSIPPHQRDARTKGIPSLGSGAIYPVPEEDITISDFEIPVYWRKFYGLDVGWNDTACAWFTHNLETDIVYLYSTYKRSHAEPVVHADAIKSRGIWIPGVIDPASKGRTQDEGKRLFTQYINLGLNLSLANNAVESGLFSVWMRLSSGRLKVFKSCSDWFDEFRIYRRDEDGKVVKEKDHLMDTTRYAIVSGIQVATAMPYETMVNAFSGSLFKDNFNEITGY